MAEPSIRRTATASLSQSMAGRIGRTKTIDDLYRQQSEIEYMIERSINRARVSGGKSAELAEADRLAARRRAVRNAYLRYNQNIGSSREFRDAVRAFDEANPNYHGEDTSIISYLSKIRYPRSVYARRRNRG